MLALLSMGSSAFAQEEVQVGTVNVPTVTRKDASKTGAQVIILEKEKKGVVLVMLENSNNKNRDLQFDLTLPEGIRLKNGETGGTSPVTTHVMGFGPTTSRFVLYSENASYLPNETLIQIPVEVAESVTDVKTLEGQIGTLSNILTSDDLARKSKLISESTTFPFRVMLLGDVNDDGSVTNADQVAVTYYVLDGSQTVPFVFEAADMEFNATKPNNITNADAISLATKLLEENPSAKESVTGVTRDVETELDPE